MGKERKKETQSLIMCVLMRGAHSARFVEMWEDIDLERAGRRAEGRVRGMGQLLCERYNCSSTLQLGKETTKGGCDRGI